MWAHRSAWRRDSPPAHLATHNRALAGVRKSFTSLPDEFLFIDENTRGIVAAAGRGRADANRPRSAYPARWPMCMFDAAQAGAARCHRGSTTGCSSQLDVERFFYSVRPYYKPYRVGRQEYRGANAGDFSGINEIDLLLGLCRANDPYYAQLLVDKMLFMLPQDQARLRECMTRTSLLDELLAVADEHAERGLVPDATRAAYLEVCDLFGQSAAQHHDVLVKRFIEKPAASLVETDLEGITASGPPLPVLLRSLETLRDLRVAAKRGDLATRCDDLAKLRGLLKDVRAEGRSVARGADRAACQCAQCVSILSTRSG